MVCAIPQEGLPGHDGDSTREGERRGGRSRLGRPWWLKPGTLGPWSAAAPGLLPRRLPGCPRFGFHILKKKVVFSKL